jgi:Fe-S-cluster containining protein
VVSLRASDSQDDRLVAAMVKPLGIFPEGALLSTGDWSRGGAYFDCRMLDGNGDCLIYASRPQMCRDYPADGLCTRTGCTESPETP